MRYEATEACLVDFSYHLWPLLLRNILTIVMISVFEDKGCVFSCNTCYIPSYPYESQFKATNYALILHIIFCLKFLLMSVKFFWYCLCADYLNRYRSLHVWFYVNVIPGELCTCINAVFNAVFNMLNTRPKIGQCDDPYIRNL